jgi:flagellar basal body rod protein FlgB
MINKNLTLSNDKKKLTLSNLANPFTPEFKRTLFKFFRAFEVLLFDVSPDTNLLEVKDFRGKSIERKTFAVQ